MAWLSLFSIAGQGLQVVGAMDAVMLHAYTLAQGILHACTHLHQCIVVQARKYLKPHSEN